MINPEKLDSNQYVMTKHFTISKESLGTYIEQVYGQPYKIIDRDGDFVCNGVLTFTLTGEAVDNRCTEAINKFKETGESGPLIKGLLMDMCNQLLIRKGVWTVKVW